MEIVISNLDFKSSIDLELNTLRFSKGHHEQSWFLLHMIPVLITSLFTKKYNYKCIKFNLISVWS